MAKVPWHTQLGVAESRQSEAVAVLEAWEEVYAAKTAIYNSLAKRGSVRAGPALREQQLCGAQLRAARKHLANANQALDELLLLTAC